MDGDRSQDSCPAPSPESQFFGNVTVNAAPQQRRRHVHRPRCTMSGETRTNTLRWESPILSIRADRQQSAGSTVCIGDVLTIVWILGR